MAFFGLLRSRRHERAGFELYTAAVRSARDPLFYDRFGVPDTVDGRFDLIGVYVFLLINRLQRAPKPGPQLAQAVFDAMFSDMDFNLREIGVSDMRVGKQIKGMWEAFHGRSQAYAAALTAGDGALTDALARNVWRGEAGRGDAGSLAKLVVAQAKHLAEQPLEALARGSIEFLPPRAVTA